MPPPIIGVMGRRHFHSVVIVVKVLSVPVLLHLVSAGVVGRRRRNTFPPQLIVRLSDEIILIGRRRMRWPNRVVLAVETPAGIRLGHLLPATISLVIRFVIAHIRHPLVTSRCI